MRVVIVGGGPSGLYLAVLLRLVDPAGEVVVLERRGPDDEEGWGVAFLEASLTRLSAADPPTYDRIAQRFERWDAIDVHVHGRTVRAGGHGFVGIARHALVEILAGRADALGADIRYHQRVESLDALDALGLGDADLVVAADGAGSALRTRYAEHFAPHLDERPTLHVCFGTTRRLDASTFAFIETPHGLIQAHAFPYDEQHSHVAVQCDPATWRGAGFDRMGVDATVAECERLLAPWLDGHPLLVRPTADPRQHPWHRVTRVTCDRWQHGRLVLLGDAAHTTHPSTPLAARLALEDALGLALALVESGDVPDEATLAAFEAERKAEVLRVRNIVGGSMEWFENAARYATLPAEQFAYALVTQTLGIGHESLRRRDAAFLDRVERILARTGAPRSAPPRAASERAADPEFDAPPPMFTPFRLRDLTLPNRIVVAPMDLYTADGDGAPNDFHVAHYGARALGGAGLVMTEPVAVAADARLSLGSTGLYADAHVDGWQRIVALTHQWTPAKVGVQLDHAGPKGSTKRLWEGNEEPLDEGGWEVIGPSAVPYRAGMRVPRAMTRDDMDRARADFVAAARRAADAGFDLLEVNCAHGHLLSAFVTPLLNRRDDEYGGSLANRLRFPVEVLAAVRAVWPADRPMSVCISATDWVDGGVDASEGVEIARAFHAAGADIVHVSAGHTSPAGRPVYGRMFQTPLSDRIRNEAGVPTIAVGNITEADQVNAIIAAGRADLCGIGRPHLTNPHWTLHSAAEPLYPGQWWPPQYERGRHQLERELQRRVDMLEVSAL